MTHLFKLTLTAALSLWGAAQAVTASRLIVADAKTNALSVVNLTDGKTLGTFSTPGKLSGLYAGPSGQYAYALHRDDDRVTVLHSGLSTLPHGDHDDLVQKAPHVLATLNVGQQPTHFFAHGDRIVIFNDKGGSVAVFGETLLGKTNDMQVVKVAQPDHGAATVMGNVLLSGYLRLNRVDAYDLKSGQLLKTVDGCPALHGEAILGDTSYFGCTDGVLAVTVKGAEITSQKLTNPAGTPESTRVGTVVAHAKSGTLYGNFGSGLARWTAQDKALTPIALPAAPLKFIFAEDGQRLLVLTADGALHALDARTGRVLQSAAGVVKPADAADKAAIRPTMTLGQTSAYLTSPTTGEVLEVALNNLTVTRRLAVGGTPAMVALTSASGEQD